MEPGIGAKAEANVSPLVPLVLVQKSVGHHREELLFFLFIPLLFLLSPLQFAGIPNELLEVLILSPLLLGSQKMLVLCHNAGERTLLCLNHFLDVIASRLLFAGNIHPAGLILLLRLEFIPDDFAREHLWIFG
jgi:hypothetical protein